MGGEHLQDQGACVSGEAEGDSREDSRESAGPRPVLWLTCTQRAGDNEFMARTDKKAESTERCSNALLRAGTCGRQQDSYAEGLCAGGHACWLGF